MITRQQVPVRRVRAIVALVSFGAFGIACGASSGSSSDTVEPVVMVEETTPTADQSTTTTSQTARDVPTVVVTYSALESIVSAIVGDDALVEVIVPNGTDPHDFEPSAKDVEAMSAAAVVVANGLDLEGGLEDAFIEVEKSGVSVFHIADHVTLREGGTDDHADDEAHSDEEGHDHGVEDPHVWLDPLTLAEAVPALARDIGERIGVDLESAGAAVAASLGELNETIEKRISKLESCVVITGHDSLGYFGARYGCEVIGSIIPGFSTAAEATAKDLAELKTLARTEGVKAIFTELGTPADVADQLAKEVGVEVVEIATHLVPDGGGYDEMMIALVDAIVGGLS